MWTRHGHHIDGTEKVEPTPTAVHPCGGLASCPDCILDSYHAPRKYIKKPIAIEAVKLTKENAELLAKWSGGTISWSGAEVWGVALDTLEGTMVCTLGDLIVKGTEGEFYSIKNNIFEKTYEPQHEDVPVETSFDRYLKGNHNG